MLAKLAEIYRQIGDYKASAQWYEYSLEEGRRAGNIDAQMTDLLRLYYLAAKSEIVPPRPSTKNKVSNLSAHFRPDR